MKADVSHGQSSTPLSGTGKGSFTVFASDDDRRGAWYAVFTRSRQEKVAANMLDALSVENFLPLKREKRTWTDRKKLVSAPLFPGYLFVRILRSNDALLRVLKVPGVVDFVRGADGPLAIPQAEIEGVEAVISKAANYCVRPFLNAGDRVRVVRGPLAGVEGMLVRSDSRSTLVISVEMIQRSVAVSIADSDVEPARPTDALRTGGSVQEHLYVSSAWCGPTPPISQERDLA